MTKRVPMFEKLMFSTRNNGRLTSREVDYWQTIFSKVLKVGEEFEVQVPQNLNLDSVYRNFRQAFSPTKNVDICGKFGILDITPDGSVPNGMELITVGRRFNWNNFYDMNKAIMGKFQEFDFYTSHHTGMHIHLLAGYSSMGTNELEQNVPEIILSNFYQLHRIFAPELYWIASGGPNRYALTRYILFRNPPFDYSPMQHGLQNIRDSLNAKYGKYQMVNMNPVVWGGDKSIERFHVEIRHPDTYLSPAYASAIVALEVAILSKAIEISQCGLISMKQDEYDMRRKLFDKFANMGTGDRDSDSSDLTNEDIGNLGKMTSDMIRWFKAEIMAVSPVAYEILQKIAETPASIMRISGKSWNAIESTIYPQELIDSESVRKINEIVILQQITDCKDVDVWKEKLSNRLSIDIKRVNDLIRHIRKEKVLVWDRELGSLMYKQIV